MSFDKACSFSTPINHLTKALAVYRCVYVEGLWWGKGEGGGSDLLYAHAPSPKLPLTLLALLHALTSALGPRIPLRDLRDVLLRRLLLLQECIAS